MIVYGSRKILNIEAFYVEFNPELWDRVVNWMRAQAEYEQAGELPPAAPERDWERPHSRLSCSRNNFLHRKTLFLFACSHESHYRRIHLFRNLVRS